MISTPRKIYGGWEFLSTGNELAALVPSSCRYRPTWQSGVDVDPEMLCKSFQHKLGNKNCIW